VLRLWRRLAGQRSPSPPSESDKPLAYDVLVTLGPYNMPAGVRPGDAIPAVRSAVEAIDGAGWVSVEHHPVPTWSGWVEVFPAPGAGPADDAAVSAIRSRVEAVVRETLASVPPCSLPEEVKVAEPSFDARLLQYTVLAPPPAPNRKKWAHKGRPPGFSDGVVLRDLPQPAVSPTAGRVISDTALLARLLAFVLPADAAPPMAERTIRQFGSYPATLAAPEIELRAVRGLGTHSIAAIKLLHTAAVRLAKARASEGPVLDNWERLMAYLNAILARERVEQFRILFLDGRNRLLADEAQARGTVNHTPVYPREVVRRALELRAESVILVHNHPSGDPSPSRADLEMTAQIQAAAKVVSVLIVDHVIVGNGRWLSFRKEGLL
jgi:DNA repair protein RadC